MDRRRALTAIGLSSLGISFLSGCGKNKETEQDEDDGLVDLLFVQDAEGVRFEGDVMTLINANPQTLFFSDRPAEIAGYLTFTEFVDLVSAGPDNFEDDPPNATLVILDGDEMVTVVVELAEKPTLDGENLVFRSVGIIQGDPPAEGGKSALFIDTIGRPLTPVSVAGVHRRHRRRRRRRVTHH